MAIMGRKKQMVARLIENRRVRNADKARQKQSDQASKEEEEMKIKILKEQGII